MEVFIQGRRGRIIARFALPVENGSYPDPPGGRQIEGGELLLLYGGGRISVFLWLPPPPSPPWPRVRSAGLFLCRTDTLALTGLTAFD
jgi:hypothetical protein